MLSFEALTRHLDPALPIYGLQGEGVNFPRGQTLNIESMASQYLEAIREVQPKGPYFLTGYSAGGVTAYETAQQIRAGGDKVGLLAIVDGNAPPAARRNVRWTPRTLWHLATNFAWWTVDDVFASALQMGVSKQVSNGWFPVRHAATRFGRPSSQYSHGREPNCASPALTPSRYAVSSARSSAVAVARTAAARARIRSIPTS